MTIKYTPNLMILKSHPKTFKILNLVQDLFLELQLLVSSQYATESFIPDFPYQTQCPP